MAQLSRPYQIGLGAVALLAVAWLLLLGGHHSSNTPSAPAVPSRTHITSNTTASTKTTPSTSKSSTPNTASSHVHKSSASAPSATKRSKPAQHKTSHVAAPTPVRTKTTSSAATPPATKTTPATKAPAPTTTAHAPSSAPSTTKTSAPSKTTTPVSPAKGSAAPARQQAVETALAHGQTVLILFWNPRGADDVAVHRAVAQLRGNRSLHVSVQEANAGEVATFGTITRGVQVYGTPTLLVVNKSGQVLTLTGVQDAYSIEQAIQESRH